MSLLEVQLSLPLLVAFILILCLVVLDAFTGKNKSINYTVSLIGLLAIGVAAAYSLSVSPSVFIAGSETDFFSKNMLAFGGYTAVFDIIFVIGGFLTLLLSKDYFTRTYLDLKELYTILICSIFGMMCISHANNLVVLFLGIETMSIPFYILTGFTRNRLTSVEGALKYFFLGAFASAFLLYGIAMIYGATGSFYYDSIREIVLNLDFYPLYLKLGIGLISVGILFKVAAFPFHQWAPDAYQAAASPLSGFLSTAGKAAAIVAFIAIAQSLMPNTLQNESIQMLIAIIAAATMIIGNVTALAQKNIKRILAYSSIGHAGYLLMGIVANNADGFAAMMYYSFAYTLTQVGAFAVISVFEDKNETNLMLDDFAGISKTYPLLAASMAMFMFSLAGIPPFAGFFGKYFLFKAAVDAGFTWLTIIAVITSIISVYYYLSVIMKMYFKEKEKDISIEKSNLSKISIVLSAAGILIFGIFSYLIIDQATGLF